MVLMISINQQKKIEKCNNKIILGKENILDIIDYLQNTQYLP